MTQAYYTGLSGLQTNTTAIDAISDNLANANTNGYRGYTTEFSSLFEENLNTISSTSTNDDTIGLGSRLQSTTMITSQGNILQSDKSTDLAIQGNGWFGVEAQGTMNYTRNGSFSFDANSNLVTDEGYYVMGTKSNNIQDNVLTKELDTTPLNDVAAQEQLTFPNELTYPVQPTTKATFSGNIGTDDEVRIMSAGVIDEQNNQNELKLTFDSPTTQTDGGTIWNVTAQTISSDGETIYDTQNGTISFDESGFLISSDLSNIDNNGSEVEIDLGNNYNGIVAISNVEISSSSSADGMQSGELNGYDINKDGDVIATFTNGKQSSVGKIALYHFGNDQGLDRNSGTLFQTSSNSGEPIFYQDTEGNNISGTTLSNFALESSNTDMTTSLTELIIYQRAYDANSKSVTTADEMIQKAIEMDG
jgi:flagellar hook protein FlgE